MSINQTRKLSWKVLKVGITVACFAIVLMSLSKSNISETAAMLSPRVLFLILCLNIIQLIVIAARFYFLSRSYQLPVFAGDALLATSAGAVLSAVMPGVVASLLGRKAMTNSKKVKFAPLLSMVLFEKFIVSLCLVTFFAGGWAYVNQSGLALVLICISTLIMICFPLSSARKYIEGRIPVLTKSKGGKVMLDSLMPPLSLGTKTATIGLSVVNHLIFLAVIALILQDVGVVMIKMNLVKEFSLLSLISSLPISLSGWGVRELSYVTVLQGVNVQAEKAFIVSVTVGLVSWIAPAITLVVLSLARPAVNWLLNHQQKAQGTLSRDGLDYVLPKNLAPLLSALIAMGLCIQIVLPIGASGLQLAVSDFVVLFAVLGGLGLTLAISSQRIWIEVIKGIWLKELLFLSPLLIVLSMGFVINYVNGIGQYSWALSRVMGVLIVGAYFILGITLGRHERAGQVFCYALIASIGLTLVAGDGLRLYEAVTSEQYFTTWFMGARGLLENRNAYSMLGLVGVCLAPIIFSQSKKGKLTGASHLLLASLLTLVIWFTGSRAAYGVLIGYGLAIMLIERRKTYGYHYIYVIGCVLLSVLGYFSLLDYAGLSQGYAINKDEIMATAIEATKASSNNERLYSIYEGINLFWSHPIIGGGLGAFLAQEIKEKGKPLIIHSTPIWFAAEMGLMGLLAYIGYFTHLLVRFYVNMITGNERIRLVALSGIMVIGVFGVMSQVHELFYQRSVWAALGIIFGMVSNERQKLQARQGGIKPKLLFLVTEDWYFRSHRLPMAQAAQEAGFQVSVAARFKDHQQSIEALGYKTIPLQWSRSTRNNPLRLLMELKNVYIMLRQENPHLIHNIALKPALFGAVSALALPRTAVISSINGLGSLFISKIFKARVLQTVLRLAFPLLFGGRNSWIIVQNPDDERAMHELGICESRIIKIPGSGVDTDRLKPAPEPQGPMTMAYVGRMLEDKGLLSLKAAYDMLRQQGHDIRLNLVGTPDPDNPATLKEEELKQWAQEPGITWFGHRSDIANVWQEAHIAVLPSRREGLPKSLLEAAACGRPLIATDVPGCREVARQGYNALLVPRDEAIPLATAIHTLATAPELRERFGQNSRSLALTMSSHMVKKTTQALYTEAYKTVHLQESTIAQKAEQ